mmetsp:Transcript_87343/g.138623  ORF Transcript_87343/g.138623 Transcript_87343/m.138623 type:complete len:242 (+) Transcript_87343:1216-1941(+)
MILLHPAMQQAFSSKETQSVMREGGWRCPSICLPSHGMLSTPRRLANHCSRNACPCVCHGFPGDHHQPGELFDFRSHHLRHIFKLRGCQPLRTTMILPRCFVTLPQNLGSLQGPIIASAEHELRMRRRHVWHATKSFANGGTYRISIAFAGAGVSQKLWRRSRHVFIHWCHFCHGLILRIKTSYAATHAIDVAVLCFPWRHWHLFSSWCRWRWRWAAARQSCSLYRGRYLELLERICLVKL